MQPAGERVYADARRVLEVLGERQLCLLHIAGWWTYEFCFEQLMRQYHQEADIQTMEFPMGFNLASREEGLDSHQGDLVVQQMSHPGKMDGVPYYSEWYNGGAECDLTHEQRCVSSGHRFLPRIGEQLTWTTDEWRFSITVQIERRTSSSSSGSQRPARTRWASTWQLSAAFPR